MKRLAGYILAAVGGAAVIWALTLFLGPNKGTMYGYDPVYGGLAAIAVLSLGILMTQNH